MLVWIGALFCVAWAIGMGTIAHPPWFAHLLLLIGGAAIGYGILFPRRASA